MNRGTWWTTVHRVVESGFINNTFFFLTALEVGWAGRPSSEDQSLWVLVRTLLQVVDGQLPTVSLES